MKIIFSYSKSKKRNKIIVFDLQKVGAGAQKSGGAAALPAPPPPRSLITKDAEKESQSEMEKVSLFPKLGKNKMKNK